MSSPYVKLGNRSLDQWKVTELREELKKRKLTTKGLKEDLVKRLDEAVRIEWETEKENTDNGSDDSNESEIPSELPVTEPIVSGKSKDLMVEKVDSKPENNIDDGKGSLGEGKLVETDLVQAAGMEGEQIDQFSTVETTVVVSETVETVETTVVVSETVETVETLSGSQFQNDGKTEENSTKVVDTDGLGPSQEEVKIELSDPNIEVPQGNESSSPIIPSLQDSETQNEATNSTVQIENDDSKSAESNVQPSKYQVSEVDPIGSQVISDSVSTESVSVIEKNELKVDVINDNVKIELNVKPEVVQASLSSVVPDGDRLHPMDVEDPLDKKDVVDSVDKKDVEEPVYDKALIEETGGSNAQNVDSLNNIDSGDLGPPEKLNLDRSSGDDSMEEDVDYNSNSDKIGDGVEKSEMPIAKEDIDVDVVGLDKPVEKKVANAGNETVPVQTSVKRKFHGKEAVGNKDNVKKPRKWTVESTKGSEPQSGDVASTTPKDSSEEAVKERIVPPSSKPPTNSLRIDRFVRPFTLKAVQELLGKTGTVNTFWMDQIKTHCFVSYSSVEEAVETRNAVYNLQWPPNGGRLLAAEFVDPQEVKTRTEPPPQSPATPSAPSLQLPNQPSPRQQLLKQQLPPSSLPPPPPPPGGERLHPSQRLNLPPPPPLPVKVDPPIVTLDDLFKKTKAIPRIYYLPLSDEQVAAKAKAQGKNNVNQ